MLKRVGDNYDLSGAMVKIGDMTSLSPFSSGLEYAAPARGSWNIVHTGFLIPEAHEIFVCAEGCLRGVVLTAAEMGASDRFSTIAVLENNLFDGKMESLIVLGVDDILKKLPKKPKAVLLYTSCVHLIMGCDLPLVFEKLKKAYPDIDFTDCYMTPIMRKSGQTPDSLMRSRLYSLLKKADTDPRLVNIIGNDFKTDKGSELFKILSDNGYKTLEIQDCSTYSEYQKMATAALNISYQSSAFSGGEELQKRLNQKHLYLPLSYDYKEIEDNYNLLCDTLGIKRYDFSSEKSRCDNALDALKEKLSNTPVMIDYTATFRPLTLALLLIKHKINVTRIYADAFTSEEQAAFDELKAVAPQIEIFATANPKMRFLHGDSDGKTVAIGQKAAYFSGSNNFVNVVECGGYYGFSGIEKFCALISDAYDTEKEARSLIQNKGLGCKSLI